MSMEQVLKEISSEPEVTMLGLFDMQVCVPKDWTDEQVCKFAEKANTCGTTGGWQIRREDGIGVHKDFKQRVTCADNDEKVHVMLDA